jgi:hypothetical protein
MAQAVYDATANAFIHGLSISCLVAGGVAAAGAIIAGVFLPSHPRAGQAHCSDEIRPSTVMEFAQADESAV